MTEYARNIQDLKDGLPWPPDAWILTTGDPSDEEIRVRAKDLYGWDEVEIHRDAGNPPTLYRPIQKESA